MAAVADLDGRSSVSEGCLSKNQNMRLHDIDSGDRVQLDRNGSVVDLQRWPGPHGLGTVIRTSGPGRYEFDHTDHHANGRPEHVYRWTT